MPVADHGPRGAHRPDPATLAVVGGLALWFFATAASNLPLREFDRLRRPDRTGQLIPNWRFFAPSPVGHDFEVVYRTRAAGSVGTCWRVALAPTPRRGLDAVWMPVRRRDKALMDLATELLRTARAAGASSEGRAHAVLAAAATTAAAREGCASGDPVEVQFAVLRHEGYGRGPRRLCHLSAFHPVPGAATAADADRPPAGAVSRRRRVVTGGT